MSSSHEVGIVEPTCPSPRCPGLPKHGVCLPYPPPGQREGVCHAAPRSAWASPRARGLSTPGLQTPPQAPLGSGPDVVTRLGRMGGGARGAATSPESERARNMDLRVKR